MNEPTPQQLAFELQAPAPAADPVNPMAEEVWLKARKLGYDKARFKAFVVAALQIVSYERSVFESCTDEELGRMLDRLTIEEEAQFRRFPNASQQDFWRTVKDWKVPQPRALQIKDAWTPGNITDWPGAYEELIRRYGWDKQQSVAA
jgi:hypothetical protein